jgi:predicted nucleotidyltransferase
VVAKRSTAGLGSLTIPITGIIIPIMGTKKPPADTGKPSSRGVADALFTKVQQRVLGLLFGNPGRSFYANEIIALAGSGTGAVQRELARLAEAGLLTVTRVGNQKHYQANATAPVFGELQGIVMKTSGLVDILRSALEDLAQDIDAAFVFGSVAKGQDAAASDIDLLVVTDRLTYADLFAALEEAGSKLGRPVNPTVYTRKEMSKRLRQGNAFVKRVLAQPKFWVIGGDDDLPA